MKKLFLLLIVSVFISCSNSDEDSTTPDISTTEIYQGDLYGDGAEGIEESRLLITNTEDWTALKNSVDSVNPVSEAFAETTIDFENYDIIAIFDKIQPNGGNSISINTIVENDDNYTVSVTTSGPEGNATLVMTQPFHIYKIPKATKPIIFI